MGIDLENGEVTVAGHKINVGEIENTQEARIREATRFIPHARVRIREAAILRLRIEDNMTWAEIAKHKDVHMSTQGVIAAYYRTVNKFIDPDDVERHRQQELKKLQFVEDAAIELYDKKKGYQSVGALQTTLKSMDRRAKLLGLDAPKAIRISGGTGLLGILAGVEPVDTDTLKQIQALDPVAKPLEAEKYDNETIISDNDPDSNDPSIQAAAQAAEDYIQNNAILAKEQEDQGALNGKKKVLFTTHGV